MKLTKRKARIGDKVVPVGEREVLEVIWVNRDSVIVRADTYTFNLAHTGYRVVV